jgi:hypothetical protein
MEELNGELMTIQEFKESVKGGSFIDYDGFGYPVEFSIDSTTEIRPSRVDEIPEGTTHIIWFNR